MWLAVSWPLHPWLTGTSLPTPFALTHPWSLHSNPDFWKSLTFLTYIFQYNGLSVLQTYWPSKNWLFYIWWVLFSSSIPDCTFSHPSSLLFFPNSCYGLLYSAHSHHLLTSFPNIFHLCPHPNEKWHYYNWPTTPTTYPILLLYNTYFLHTPLFSDSWRKWEQFPL